MAAIFIEPLAMDSNTWKIIGARNITFDDKLSKPQIEIYCYSNFWKSSDTKKRRFKSFNIPLGHLKYLTAGSLWRHGVKVNLSLSAYHMGDILAHKCELIQCKETLTNEQLLKKLKKSTNVYRTFLDSTNYLQYKHNQRTLNIPCSEVIRHFFAPSQRFLNELLTGNIDNILNPHKRLALGFNPKRSEIQAIELISACKTGLAAARHPYKSIKLTHIKNVHSRESKPFLLSASLPINGILAVWSYGAEPVHTSEGLAFVVTNFESEPKHSRARTFRECNPMSRDFGPYDILC